MKSSIYLIGLVVVLSHPAFGGAGTSYDEQARQTQLYNIQRRQDADLDDLRMRQERANFEARAQRGSDFVNSSRVNNPHAVAPSPSAGPSAEEIADAIVQKQAAAKRKTDTVAVAKDALNLCQVASTWLKQNKNAAITKASFADARACLDYAITAASAARNESEPELGRQLDDAAYELRVLILSLDK